MVRAIALVTALAACLWAQYPGSLHAASPSAHDIAFTSIDGEPLPLSSFAGKAVLVVNTASLCGFTYQYAGLQEVFDRYRDRGLVVAGFPSNDFAGQEPGTEQEIRKFCRLTYGVEFPMFEKVHVKGSSVDPFYQHLARETGVTPRWNFHKYLIDRSGRVVASFPSQVKPDDRRLVDKIEELL